MKSNYLVYDHLWFKDGLSTLFSKEMIEYVVNDEKSSIPISDGESVVDYEEEDDGEERKLNGIGEYAYGFWSRWSRTGPKALVVK